MKADPSSDTFKTIKSKSSGSYKEKGSRFFAAAFPVSDEEEIRNRIDETRKLHRTARHNCYAYILGKDGSVWRADDDGEPSGTAGKPILGQIRSFGLSDVLIIVSRYFGGTLLGTSGLINAYKTAAGEALKASEIINKVIMESYEIRYPYSAMNEVMRIIKEESVIHVNHQFDLNCVITVSFRQSAKQRIIERLSRIEGLNYYFLDKR